MDWYLTVAVHLVIVVGILSAFLGMVMLIVHIGELLWIETHRIKGVRPEPRGFEVVAPSEPRPQRQ